MIGSMSPEVARQIISIREALVCGSVFDAYLELYQIADPTFSMKDPWKEVEQLADLAPSAGASHEKG